MTRAYDGAGRLVSVADWAARTHTFAYDAHDNLLTQSYPNTAKATFGYDAADRLTNVSHAKGNKSLAAFAYTRDPAGLLSSDNAQTYAYDVNDRLTSSSAGPATSYNYDAADNPTSLVSGALTSTFTHDAAHQLATLTRSDGQAFSFTYDANGNRTAKKNDAWGRTAYGSISGYCLTPSCLCFELTEGGVEALELSRNIRINVSLSDGDVETLRAGLRAVLMNVDDQRSFDCAADERQRAPSTRRIS